MSQIRHWTGLNSAEKRTCQAYLGADRPFGKAATKSSRTNKREGQPLFAQPRSDNVTVDDSVHFHSYSCPVRGLHEVVEFRNHLLNPHLQVVEQFVVLSCRRRIGLLHQRE